MDMIRLRRCCYTIESMSTPRVESTEVPSRMVILKDTRILYKCYLIREPMLTPSQAFCKHPGSSQAIIDLHTPTPPFLNAD